MRTALLAALFLLPPTIGLGIGYFASSLGSNSSPFAFLSETYTHIAYDRQLTVHGNTELSSQDVERRLPFEQSNFWWTLNMTAVATILEADASIKKAALNPCGGSGFFTALKNWGCYEVTIEEEDSRYIAKLQGQDWLVSSEGKFLHASVRAGLKQTLPHINGLGPTPELARSQLQQVMKLINYVEEATALKVTNTELLDNGEAILSLLGLGATIHFDITEQSDAHLKDRAARLHSMLSMLRKNKDITALDLTLERTGVLRFREALNNTKKDT